MKEIFTEERRVLQGASENLVVEMRLYDEESYYNFFRMSPLLFDHLLSIVGPYITKQDAVRSPIPAKTRLELTLRYLATGDSMKTLGGLFRVSPPSVSGIIAEVCVALWCKLKFIVFPELNEATWKQIAKEFDERWNFPHLLGALDGKLLVMKV